MTPARAIHPNAITGAGTRLQGIFSPGDTAFGKSAWHSHPGPMVALMRHGRISGLEVKRFIGASNLPLDSLGRAQARSWSPRFNARPPDLVLSSPLGRCRHTAALACPGHAPHIIPGLSEIFLGQWEGRAFADIKKETPHAFEERGRHLDHFRPPGGESFSDLSHRVWQALTPFWPGGNGSRLAPHRTLVVTHAGVIRVILCRILGIPLKSLFLLKPDYGQLFLLANPGM